MKFSDLIAGTAKVDSNRVKDYVKSGVSLLGTQDLETMKVLNFKVSSESGRGAYTATLAFRTVESPKELIESQVYVNCDCMDHKFVFAYHNHVKGCHYGNAPEAYEKKTNRPSKNPEGHVGACKHLLSSFNYMVTKGIARYS